MAYNERANKATQKYQREKLDDFHLRIRKGKKEIWSKAAAERGMTFSALFIAAMDAYVAKSPAEKIAE